MIFNLPVHILGAKKLAISSMVSVIEVKNSYISSYKFANIFVLWITEIVSGDSCFFFICLFLTFSSSIFLVVFY